MSLPRHTWLFIVVLTYHSIDFHGIVARVVPASSGQMNYGTPPPTTHLEIYGGVLFTMVTVMEWRDSTHWLRDSDADDNFKINLIEMLIL